VDVAAPSIPRSPAPIVGDKKFYFNACLKRSRPLSVEQQNGRVASPPKWRFTPMLVGGSGLKDAHPV